MRETVCDYGFCDCRFSLILLGVNFQILLFSLRLLVFTPYRDL